MCGTVAAVVRWRCQPGDQVLGQSLARPLASRLRRHTSDGRYRPEIDGLRFFAIALVIFGHLAERCLRNVGFDGLLYADEQSLLSAVGDMASRGVFLFFSVSGFIISTQFLRQSRSPLSPSFLKRYFSRRVLRIEPPYFIVLIVTFVFVSLTHYSPPQAVSFSGPPDSMSESFLASLAYLHGLLFGSFPRLFPPGWSLELEIQFYLIAPVLFALFFSIRARLLRAAVGLTALALFTFVAGVVRPSEHAPFLQLSLVRFGPYFWLGILLADWQDVLRTALAKRPLVGTLTGWAGCLSLMVIDGGAGSRTEMVASNLYVLAGIFMMFVGALAMTSSFCRFCQIPLVAIVGGQCYSIYLTHLQPMQVLTPLIVDVGRIASPTVAFLVCGAIEVPVVLGVATIFYVLVERPFMIDNWPMKLASFVTTAVAKRRVSTVGRGAAADPADLG
jgi:peptidoglycan/LPS O-acetylase OafA/YrhL